MRPSLPVILVEGILDEDDWILFEVADVQVCEFLAGDLLRAVVVRVLEVQVVLPVLLIVALGRSGIESDLDLAFVASKLEGLDDKLKGLFGAGDIGCETSLITDVGS